VALYLQCSERDRCGVSGDIQHEGATVDHPKQLTMTMFYIIVKQLLELKIPILLPGSKNETNLVKLLFSFRIHFSMFEACTLIVDPLAQF
jgi:hypothetical protein